MRWSERDCLRFCHQLYDLQPVSSFLPPCAIYVQVNISFLQEAVTLCFVINVHLTCMTIIWIQIFISEATGGNERIVGILKDMPAGKRDERRPAHAKEKVEK